MSLRMRSATARFCTHSTELPKMAPKWVVDVRDKLSRYDGFQLLKILYYKDGIPERELDGASNVFRVYNLSKRYSNNDDGAAVALLFYRLSLLVPRSVHPGEVSAAALHPEKLRLAKNLGAEDCLDHFAKCGLSKPAEPWISPEARLPECFAITFVNLSPRMRRDFEEQLSIAVGVYREKQLDLFNLFCRLSHGSGETTADRFIEALNNARVPSPIFEQLQDQLDSHDIQYTPFAIETLKTREETKEDYYSSDTRPLINITKTYHRGPCAEVCTVSRVACCLIPIIPLALFVIAVTVSTPIISNIHSKNEVEQFETSRNLYEPDYQCSTRDPLPPVIHLGTFSSEWYDGFLIKQDLPDKNLYEYKNLDVYVVQSHKVVERSMAFDCEGIDTNNGIELELSGVYFLSGTNVSFNICIRSVDLVKDGWVDMAFYSNRPSYDQNDNNTVKYHRFLIGPNQTNCYPYSFTAPFDSFYYIRMGTSSQCSSVNVTAISFRMNADMRYVNASDPWLMNSDKRGACNRSDYSSEKECKFIFPSSSFSKMQEYDIFAKVTSITFQSHFGHLSIQPMFRRESLALPTIGGVVVLVPVEITLIIVVCCCVCKRKQRTRNLSFIEDGEDIKDYGAIQ